MNQASSSKPERLTTSSSSSRHVGSPSTRARSTKAPVLIRQGFPGRLAGVELVRWFPETARVVDTYPTLEETCDAFAAAGFRREALASARLQHPNIVAVHEFGQAGGLFYFLMEFVDGETSRPW